ncbi:proline racemase family protein [Pseudomonas qingdaonensis]|uniref:proline racemase family protein n=1 Tax=Pseudomonas qingdaonensis TaxID=2056231 RepID=UPI001F222ABB|nr:proline racemase family protein [Pseudomonas qingdaonensis]
MNFKRMINVVSAHAAGERNDVITGGVLDVPGNSMFDKMKYLETQGDDLRKLLLQEPRGSVTQCINLVLPSSHPEADVGFVIMESEFYPPMSGTNTICTVTALLETGMIPMVEPVTRLTLEVPGLGTLTVDVAYGGMIYVLADAQALGFAITPDEAADMVRVGEAIKAAAAEQYPAVHPQNPQIHTINQTLFAGPVRDDPLGLRSRNGVIVSPGRLDRSPCGTGTSARLAVMHARGQIKPGQRLVHESILSTEFIGEIVETLDIGGRPGIRPAIAGQAWITGFHQYVLDPTDPFPTGYTLSDTWRKNG